MTSWTPSWNYDVISEMLLRQSMNNPSPRFIPVRFETTGPYRLFEEFAPPEEEEQQQDEYEISYKLKE